MKFMVMMHVGRDGAADADWAPEDVMGMIEFQRAVDAELEDNGEMVFNAGLGWPDQARIVRDVDGAPAVSDGPFPEGRVRPSDRRRPPPHRLHHLVGVSSRQPVGLIVVPVVAGAGGSGEVT